MAIVGNALILAAIWRNASLRTPSYIFLAGLAITDFFTGLIIRPAFIAYMLGNPILYESKNFRVSAITIFNSAGSYFYSATMVTVTVMAVERWLHMSRRTLITARRAYYIHCLVLLALLPYPILRSRILSEGTILDFFHPLANGALSLICLVVTTFAYFKVFRIIHRQKLQVAAIMNQASRQDCGQPTAINLTKYRKSVYTILYILLLFWCTFLPQAIGVSIFVLLKKAAIQISFEVFHIGASLCFMSSSLNPLLYYWRLKDIREEVKLLMRKITCKD